MEPHRPLRLGDLCPGDHVAFLYENDAERREVFTAFIRQGLERGEKVLCVLADFPAEAVLGPLGQDGLEPGPYQARGQLLLLTRGDPEVPEGAFDPARMSAVLQAEGERAGAEGYPALRVIGDLSWAAAEPAALEALVVFEARATERMPERMLALCAYDRRRFSPAALLDLAQVHPLVLLGTELYSNPNYVPWAEFGESGLGAVRFERWLRGLREQRQTQEALHANEDRYRILFETSRDIMVVHEITPDGMPGQHLEANDEACRRLGYTREEMLQRSVPDNPATAAGNRAMVRRVMEEGSALFERVLVARDGRQIPVEIVAHRFDMQGRTVILSVCRDITERRQAQAAQQAANETLRAMIEGSPVAIGALDLQGLVVEWNPAAEALFGWRKEEVLGQPLPTVPEEGREEHQAIVARTQSGEALSVLELRRRRKDGSLVDISLSTAPWRDASGRIGGAIALFADITAHKRAERELARLASFPELNPNPVVEVGRKGKVHYLNAAAREAFPDLEAAGLEHPFLAGLRETVAEWPSGAARLIRREAAVGDRRYERSVSPVSEGQRVRVYGWDITDRKEAEARQEAVSAGLEAVLAVGDELIACPDTDSLCRRAIELARERLGLERCGLLLVDGGDLVGTYGTDMEGRTTDEHTIRNPAAAAEPAPLRLPLPEEPRWTVSERAYTHGEDGRLVSDGGHGWVVVTPIYAGDRALGFFSNDAAITGAPLNPVQQDMVAVYCTLLARLLERTHVQEALARSEEIYREAIQASGGVPYRRNFFTDSYDFVGSGVEELLGWRPEELTVERLRGMLRERRVVDPEAPTTDWLEYASAFDRGEWPRHQTEYRLVTPQGEEKWISDHSIPVRDPQSGQVAGSLGILQDITWRRQAEEQLRASLQLNQTTLATIPSSILVLDAELRVVMANRVYLERRRASEAEIVGRSIEALFAAPLLAEQGLLSQLRALAAAGDGQSTLLGVWHRSPEHPDRFLDLRLCGFRLASESGEEERRVLVVFDDVTERRRLEERLRQASRLESVGQLAGGVAHDFNNILTGIIGYAQLLQRDLAENPSAARDLARIQELGTRAASLTSQLLSFSRRQTLQPVILNLNDLIRNTAEMLRRLIGEDVDLQFHPAADLGLMRADAAQLDQVLVNLAVNARDAMPHGGQLTVETANVELNREQAAAHVGVTPGPYVLLAVTDTGMGMDEETRSRVFEPFFTTKEVGRGTGLGLASVYGTVTQHGGAVAVYSEPGRGSTFKVYLPRFDPATLEVAPVSELDAAAPRGDETVLVVEDEDAVRLVVGRMLENLGYRVLIAPGPREAEELFAEHGETVRLLLTDVVMPQLTGPELYQRLAARSPALKVLFMSGYAPEAAARNGHALTALTCVPKPFSAAVLAQRVRAALDG